MFNDNNIKGGEQASIDLSLEQLQLDYVDLLLIHNPITSRNEYRAACAPHFFEFLAMKGDKRAVNVETLPDGENLRLVLFFFCPHICC